MATQCKPLGRRLSPMFLEWDFRTVLIFAKRCPKEPIYMDLVRFLSLLDFRACDALPGPLFVGDSPPYNTIDGEKAFILEKVRALGDHLDTTK